MANGRGGHYGGRALGVTNPGGLRVKPVLPSKSIPGVSGKLLGGATVRSKSTDGIGYLEGTDGMGLMTGLAVASLASSAIGSWLQNRAQNKATQAQVRGNQRAQAETRQGELFNRDMARAEMNRNMPRARIANAALQWGMKDTGAKEAGFFDYHPSTWDPNYVMTADQGRLQRQIDEDIAMENQRKHRGFGMATYASPSKDYGMAPYSSPRESVTMSDMVMRTPQGTFQEEQIRETNPGGSIWAPPPIDFDPDAPWGKPRPDGGGPMPPPGGGGGPIWEPMPPGGGGGPLPDWPPIPRPIPGPPREGPLPDRREPTPEDRRRQADRLERDRALHLQNQEQENAERQRRGRDRYAEETAGEMAGGFSQVGGGYDDVYAQRLEAMRRGRPEPRGKTGPSSRSGSFGRGPAFDEEYISMSRLVP